MADIVIQYSEPVVAPDGDRFIARVCALPTAGRWQGRWQAWVEFTPVNGAPTFRSHLETLQPSRAGVAQWASDQTPRSLEHVLDRALDRVRGSRV